MKTGLVLEGGAMRGMFTAGIIDVFMEEGIRFDGTIGVSAGAAFGVNFKTCQIGRAIRYNKRFCRDPRYCGFWSLLRDGNIYSRDFAYDKVPLMYDRFHFATYSENPMPFYLVCTDVETGQPVYHEYKGWVDNTFEWIRASSSMPLVSQFVELEGRKLLDGGISDSIPLQYFESIGYDRNVVVLTQPPMYEKAENGLLSLVRWKYKKYPELVKAMEQRHLKYNDTLRYIEEREKSGEILVIRPDAPLPVGRVEKNPDKLQQAYEIGRQMAYRRLAEVKAFLGEKAMVAPQVPYRNLKACYSRHFEGAVYAYKEKQVAEYWLEFENGCIHINADERFVHAESVPAEAELRELPSSFTGASLAGIYEHEDGGYLISFDNGGLIHLKYAEVSRSSDVWLDWQPLTPEEIADGGCSLVHTSAELAAVLATDCHPVKVLRW
ncbi:MAG: patatin family protein [Akkermansia sp.]|nr:patatin family protein [Akkermansia sp.]